MATCFTLPSLASKQKPPLEFPELEWADVSTKEAHVTCIHHQAPGAYNYHASHSGNGSLRSVVRRTHYPISLDICNGLEIILPVYVQGHCRAINLFVLLISIRPLQANISLRRAATVVK